MNQTSFLQLDDNQGVVFGNITITDVSEIVGKTTYMSYTTNPTFRTNEDVTVPTEADAAGEKKVTPEAYVDLGLKTDYENKDTWKVNVSTKWTFHYVDTIRDKVEPITLHPYLTNHLYEFHS